MGNILIKIIRVVVNAISPELRNVLTGSINTLKKQAEATDSMWDDVLVEMLCILLGIGEKDE